MAEVHGSINSVNLPAHICWFVNPPQPLCCSACVLHVGLVRATSLLVFLSFLPADEWPGKALGQFSSLPPKASLPFHFPSVPSQFVKTYKPSFSIFFSPFFPLVWVEGWSRWPPKVPSIIKDSTVLFLLCSSCLSSHCKEHLLGTLSALWSCQHWRGGSQKKAISLFYTKMMKSPQNNFTNSDLNTQFCLYFS